MIDVREYPAARRQQACKPPLRMTADYQSGMRENSLSARHRQMKGAWVSVTCRVVCQRQQAHGYFGQRLFAVSEKGGMTATPASDGDPRKTRARWLMMVNELNAGGGAAASK